MARSKQIFNGDPTTRESILASALAEIDQYGIIGLRLSAVAEKAQVSVPLIYKYFEDRDGLLAAVLGDWYEGFVFQFRSMIDNWIDSAEQISLEQFAQLWPKPGAGAIQKDREFRLKVLATALENPQLHQRVKQTTIEAHAWIEATIDRVTPKLPKSDQFFDRRFLSLLLFNTMFVFDDMLDRAPISDESYIELLSHLFRASSHANTPKQ